MSITPRLSPRICSASGDQRPRQGFTLIELLMVFGVIGILAAITFGISQGVRNAQARAKAQTELVVISQAIESFKASNGDFPWATDDEDESAEELFKALLGWKKFNSASGEMTFEDKNSNEVPNQGPKAFLDVSKMTYIDSDDVDEDEFNPKLDNSSAPDNFLLLDPWGEPYLYYYKTGSDGAWENFGFVLYSMGPDGEHSPVGADGILTDDLREQADNIDNIYAGE